MNHYLKNKAIFNDLVRQLRQKQPADPDAIRQECLSVICACFQSNIEPFQLPVSSYLTGNLSTEQKNDFYQRYIILHLNHYSRELITAEILTSQPTWSSLIKHIEDLTCT